MMKKFVDTHELTTIGSLKVGLYYHMTAERRFAGRVSALKSQLSNSRLVKKLAKTSETTKSSIKASIKLDLADAEESLEAHAEFVTKTADEIRAASQQQLLGDLRRDMDWYKAAGENPDALKELEQSLHNFPLVDAAEFAKCPEVVFGVGFPVRGIEMTSRD